MGRNALLDNGSDDYLINIPQSHDKLKYSKATHAEIAEAFKQLYSSHGRKQENICERKELFLTLIMSAQEGWAAGAFAADFFGVEDLLAAFLVVDIVAMQENQRWERIATVGMGSRERKVGTGV